jgi:tetratricopeptide (TPR) repeat protein
VRTFKPSTAGLVVLILWVAAYLPACASIEAWRGAASRPATTQPAAKEYLHLAELTPPAVKPVNAAAPLPPAVELQVIDAEHRISRDDFAGAVGLLNQIPPASVTGRVTKDLGLAYLGLGDRTKALDYLSQAERTAGDDVLLQLLLGQLEASAGHANQAILTLRRALLCSSAMPEDALTGEAMLSLGEMLASNGYLTAADECFAKLYDWVNQYGRSYAARPRLRPLVLQPQRLLARRGEMLLRLGRCEQARDVLSAAYARDRTDTQTGTWLLQADLAMKDYAAAEKLLLDIATEPTAQDQLPNLARLLCQEAKDPSMPARIWQASRREAVGAGAMAVALAKAAHELHADGEAKEILDSALKIMPNDVEVRRYMAEQYARTGQAMAAVRQLAALLQADADAVDTVNDTLEALVNQNLLPEGLEDHVAEHAEMDMSGQKGALHYLAGELADIRGNTAMAAEQYQAAVQADEHFLPAYEAAANLALAEGRYDQVDKLVKRLEALAKAGQDVRYYALYLRGQSQLAQGRLNEAMASLEASCNDHDGFSPAVDLLAETYGRLGRPDDEIRILEDLLKLEPDDENGYRRLFNLDTAFGRIDQARAVMAKLLQLHPQSRAGQAMFVELLLMNGKVEEGRRILEELRHQAKDDPDVRLLTVRLEVESASGAPSQKQFDDWTTELGKVMTDLPGSLPARRLLATLLVRVGYHRQASAVLGELYAENPGLGDLAKSYVMELIQSGDSAAAQAVLESNPILRENTQARQWLIQVLMDQGRLDEAARRLRDWLAASKDKVFGDFCRLQLLDVYEKLRDFSSAQRQIDELLASNPPHTVVVELQAMRVKLLCMDGKYDRAVDLARTWAGKDRTPDFKLSMIGVLADAKRYDQAQGLLDGWIRQGGAGQEILAESKVILWGRAGKLPKALDYAQAWMASSPAALEPRRAAVAVLVDANEYGKALKLVDDWLAALDSCKPATRPAATEPASQPQATTQAVQPSPKTATQAVAATEPDIAATQPTIAATQPATAAAATSPSTAAASQPTTASHPAQKSAVALPAAAPPTVGTIDEGKSWGRQTAVRLLMMMDRYDQALDRVTAYLRAEPDDDLLVSLQASVLAELGRDKESLAAMEKAQSLASDDAGANNNLGYLYADKGVQLAKAEGLIRQAIAARGDQKDFQDSLGWVLYKEGKFPAAGELFDRLLDGGKAVWPGCAVSYDHAGDVYYRLGWTEKAADLWARAVALARQEKSSGRDLRQILKEGPAKIQAVQTGQEPAVAPLGRGVEASR